MYIALRFRIELTTLARTCTHVKPLFSVVKCAFIWRLRKNNARNCRRAAQVSSSRLRTDNDVRRGARHTSEQVVSCLDARRFVRNVNHFLIWLNLTPWFNALLSRKQPGSISNNFCRFYIINLFWKCKKQPLIWLIAQIIRAILILALWMSEFKLKSLQ